MQGVTKTGSFLQRRFELRRYENGCGSGNPFAATAKRCRVKGEKAEWREYLEEEAIIPRRGLRFVIGRLFAPFSGRRATYRNATKPHTCLCRWRASVPSSKSSERLTAATADKRKMSDDAVPSKRGRSKGAEKAEKAEPKKRSRKETKAADGENDTEASPAKRGRGRPKGSSKKKSPAKPKGKSTGRRGRPKREEPKDSADEEGEENDVNEEEDD